MISVYTLTYYYYKLCYLNAAKLLRWGVGIFYIILSETFSMFFRSARVAPELILLVFAVAIVRAELGFWLVIIGAVDIYDACDYSLINIVIGGYFSLLLFSFCELLLLFNGIIFVVSWVLIGIRLFAFLYGRLVL